MVKLNLHVLYSGLIMVYSKMVKLNLHVLYSGFIILMSEFRAEYISENRVIVHYEVLYLVAFIYMYLFI